MLSDIILLINKGKGPNTHLPTGKLFNYSQDYKYYEFNMQTYSPDFAQVHGSVLTEISILLHLSTVISQHLCGNVICSGKLEADASRKSNEWLPSVWKLPILIWAILTYHSVDIASSVSLVEHLPKIGVLWCFEKCSCIKRRITGNHQSYFHFKLNDFITRWLIMWHADHLHFCHIIESCLLMTLSSLVPLDHSFLRPTCTQRWQSTVINWTIPEPDCLELNPTSSIN